MDMETEKIRDLKIHEKSSEEVIWPDNRCYDGVRWLSVTKLTRDFLIVFVYLIVNYNSNR
jgi:hypothetical protein